MIPILMFIGSTTAILTLTAEFMLLAIVVASLFTFCIMATFKGKSLLDWFFQFRELALALVCGHVFLVLATDFTTEPLIRALVYGSLAFVCVGIVVGLIREHVFYIGAPTLKQRWTRMRDRDKPTV